MEENLETLDAEKPQNEIIPGVVDEKIRVLRNQLRDTYNLLINSRDMLSTVSFDKMKQESASKNENVSKTDVDEIIGAKTVSDSLKILKQKIDNTEVGSASTTLPEVNTFFGALNTLTKGMEKIQSHRESMNELNTDVHNAILEFEKSIVENQTQFESCQTEGNNKE